MSIWRLAGIMAVSACGMWLADQRACAEDASRAGAAPAAAPAPAANATAMLAQQLCKIDIKGDKKEQWLRLPQAESSVTQHRLSAGGKSLDYTATAGTLIVRDDDDKPMASMGYVAYVRQDGRGGPRPIMFAFNGGPGSSSMWLHMGVLGPKRVVVTDLAPTPPGPYHT